MKGILQSNQTLESSLNSFIEELEHNTEQYQDDAQKYPELSRTHRVMLVIQAFLENGDSDFVRDAECKKWVASLNSAKQKLGQWVTYKGNPQQDLSIKTQFTNQIDSLYQAISIYMGAQGFSPSSMAIAEETKSRSLYENIEDFHVKAKKSLAEITDLTEQIESLKNDSESDSSAINTLKTKLVDGSIDEISVADIISEVHDKAVDNADKVKLAYDEIVLGLDGDFKRSVASEDVNFGFHKKQYALQNLITYQGWDTEKELAPINYSGAFSLGRKFEILGKPLSVFLTGSHSKSFEYQEGVFRAFRSNVLDKAFPAISRQVNINKGIKDNENDIESFISKTNTTGYINVGLKLNEDNVLKYNTLFVNKSTDNLYEQGRKGYGYVFDQDPQEDGAFVRDQNFRQTTLFVNQLIGKHNWSENNTLNWAGGYNFVLAEEPNRIRNEVNILDIKLSPTIQYAHVGDFQQRKSSQKIQDTEYNGFVENKWALGLIDEDDNKPFSLNTGLNFRYKERTFKSLFVGVKSKGFTAPSIDNLSSTFTTTAFNNGLILRTSPADRYEANLTIMAGFVNFDFALENKLSGNLGLRFERDEIDAIWDVANFYDLINKRERLGTLNRVYQSLYPSVNLKYKLSENKYLRFASSITQTLPEFKELSPFEYVSPTGRVTKGNPNLEKSEIYNFDLKYEMFPKKGQVFSTTAFYKQINNPINLAQTRGSSGYFFYANTGKKATVYGFELEAKTTLLKNNEEESVLSLTGNLTKMWLKQDLLKDFQYKNITKSSLQGASDFIANGSLTYSNHKEKEFIATLTGNYSSDKIYALGSPEDFANSASLYNDEIIEKGFVALDLVVSKKLSNNLLLKLIGKNLLNPEIKQTQLVKSLITDIETNQTVLSYKKGSQLSLSVKYTF